MRREVVSVMCGTARSVRDQVLAERWFLVGMEELSEYPKAR